MSQTAKNAGLVGSLTMASRVLGLVRDMLHSRMVGGGAEQSAFTLAFLIPNLFRRLFGEGALTAAFLPVFKGEIEAGRRDEALKLARAVATIVVSILAAFVLAGVLGAGVALSWWDVAAADPDGRAALTLRLVAMLLPYAVFICAAAFCMAALNAIGRFFASSLVPCILNVVWIAALGFAAAFGSGWTSAKTVSFLAVAIVFAGALQFLFLFFALKKRGWPLKPTFRGWRSPKTKLVWRKTGQAAIGAGAIQISTACDQALAQIAAPWAAGILSFANRLVELPLAVVGTAFSTVLLPVFSGCFGRGDLISARREFASAASRVLSLMIPAATGLALLAPDAARVIFEGKAFVAEDTLRVSRAVVCYAPGLVFFGLNKTLVPWFQAQGDVKTPVAVSVVMVAVNAVLNVVAVALLPVELRHAGIAAATVFSAVGSCALLSRAALRKNGSLGFRRILRGAAASLCASAAMGASIVAGLSFYPNGAENVCSGAVLSWAFSALRLVLIAAVGASVYFASLKLFRKIPVFFAGLN